MIAYLSVEDVRNIRTRLAETLLATTDAFGAATAIDPGKMESAVERQRAGFGERLKYTTVHDVAATLLYGLVMNHAFENGNKRTALVTLLVFLDRNKRLLSNTSEDDLYALLTDLAAGRLDAPRINGESVVDAVVRYLATWIDCRTIRKPVGDKLIRFSELKAILQAQDCSIAKPHKNYVVITRGDRRIKIGYPKHDFEIDSGEVKRIRKALGLNAYAGIDSASFYSVSGLVDGFVNKYRTLLDRLVTA